MNPNVKPSDHGTIVGAISPQSTASTVTSGWIDAGAYAALRGIVITGVLGTSATVDAKFQQATDSSGTGAKDVTGSAITQIPKATGDNVQANINLYPEALDLANGFRYVRLSITVGTAASLVAGLVEGYDARYQPASAPSSVVQTVTVTG